jgi:hypothetical protein
MGGDRAAYPRLPTVASSGIVRERRINLFDTTAISFCFCRLRNHPAVTLNRMRDSVNASLSSLSMMAATMVSTTSASVHAPHVMSSLQATRAHQLQQILPPSLTTDRHRRRTITDDGPSPTTDGRGEQKERECEAQRSSSPLLETYVSNCYFYLCLKLC